MDIVATEEYADLPEAPELTPPAPSAPSVGAHLAVLAVMVLFGVPGVWLMLAGETLAGTLLVAIPYVVICLIEPFLGLCLLFAISPLDSIYTFGVWWASGTKILAMPLGLGFILRLMTTPSVRFRLPKEAAILFALSAWGILAVAWSPFPVQSAWGSSQFVLLTILLVMVVGMVRSPAHFKQLLLYVFVGTVALSAFMLVYPTAVMGTGRTTFSEVNPNSFGRALAFGFLGGIYLAWESRSAPRKLLLFAGCIVLLIGVAGTQGRGTYAALAGSLVAAILITYRARIFGALIALIGLALVVVLVGFLAYQLGFFAEKHAIERLTTWDITTGGRDMIWRAGLSAGSERILSGWGLSMFAYVSGTGRDSHSTLLRLFVELGVPGVATWLLIMLMLAISAIRAPTRSGRFLMTSLVGMVFLGGLTFNNLMSKTIWYEIGVVLALREILAYRATGAYDTHGQGFELGSPEMTDRSLA